MRKHSNDLARKFEETMRQVTEDAKTPEEMLERVRKFEAEELKNNPFVPPEGCPINDLPNELLAHIFWLGFIDDGEESDDEEDWEDSDTDDDGDSDVLPTSLGFSLASQAVGAGVVGIEHVVETGFDLESARRRAAEVNGTVYKYTIGGGLEESAHSCGDCDDHDDHSTMSSVDSDMDDSDDSVDEDARYTLPFQVLVSHVCHHWRNVALDSPGLWTQIDFREGTPYERSQIMLERSKNLPLAIDINCDMTTVSPRDDDQDVSPDELDEAGERLLHSLEDVNTMLDILSPHIDRWQSVEIMVQRYKYMHRFLQRFSQLPGAPQLEILQLYHYEENEDRSHFLPKELNDHFDIFQGNTPKLTTISLWGVHIKWPVLCTKQRCAHESCERGILSNIKDMELAYHTFDVRPSYSALASYLRSSTQLHTLALCQSGPAGKPSEWPPARESLIELPTVRELAIMYQECDYACALLDRLVLPNLESLAVDFDEEDYSALARHLSGPAAGDTHGHSLLSRLTRLKIAGFNTDKNGIDHIYGQLDKLQALNLNLESVEFGWFVKLMEPRPQTASSSSSSSVAPAPSPQMYLPNMDTFTVAGLDGADVRGFVEMRKEKGIPLKKVFASDDTRVNKLDLKWLQENVDFEYFEPSDTEDIVDISDEDSDDDSFI